MKKIECPECSGYGITRDDYGISRTCLACGAMGFVMDATPDPRDAEIASLRAEVARLAASTKYARIVAIVREWGGGGHGLPSRLRNNGDYTTAALVEALRGVIGGSDA